MHDKMVKEEFEQRTRDNLQPMWEAIASGPITWADIEDMGYTPEGVRKLIENYLSVVAARKQIVATNNKYLQEIRELKAALE
jgi:hypothetical protein